jgi:hypothetical protein
MILQKLVNLYRIDTFSAVLVAGTTASCAFLLYNNRPLPVLSVHHIEDKYSTDVEVHIVQGSTGIIKDLKYKHNNLECLESKGYKTISYTTGGFTDHDPVLELRNNSRPDYKTFIADCKECKVSTDIKCKGFSKQNSSWEMYSSNRG